MPTLNEEVHQVQNPALGAMLVWRYVVGYHKARSDAAGCPLPLLFLVLPLSAKIAETLSAPAISVEGGEVSGH
jgi:hypothetical protein